ncbi:SDR family oxidoreductase [Actinomadura sp. ATCC 31491]|uniref:SDR family oxidoreductase n=1 Tax=Actinomadura luzonensis TaxID=2805427 RepID=A0ABT0G442_9ACTN|nr:SDR family oxidoreductase [Actinomadura luzonensis]MCK2219369.1 SDR family oxidoreductase [Actinomadura luzonensis]
MGERHALVFGAAGYVGRSLVLELGRAGVRVSVAARGRESYERLARWLAAHGHEDAPADVRADFASPALIDDASTADVTEIYNCAGAYRFGMTEEEARRGNVDSVRAVVAFAAALPRLRRLVHVSGYRVGGQDPAAWDGQRRRAAYAALGAYEASKAEADAVLQAAADERGVPWSIVNPSSVIGGAGQYVGLAATLKELWLGRLAALPGGARTFVPVVEAGYLARFMALLPEDPATARRAYWVLDERTPALPDLLTLVARHYEVPVPRLRAPVALIRRLPPRLTRTDPETLTFLSEERYPTGPAAELAARHGLARPDTAATILAWADDLAAHRFGEAPEPADRPAPGSGDRPGAAPAGGRRFRVVGGVRTFETGPAGAPAVVLPGLPVNADTWAAVGLPGTRVADLPGLGLSGGGPADWPSWLAALLAAEQIEHVVGHSLGAALALEASPRTGRLTLVAPFFLQARTPSWTPATRLYLRRVSPEALARRLTGDPAHAAALRTSVADLRRPGVAATAARPDRGRRPAVARGATGPAAPPRGPAARDHRRTRPAHPGRPRPPGHPPPRHPDRHPGRGPPPPAHPPGPARLHRPATGRRRTLNPGQERASASSRRTKVAPAAAARAPSTCPSHMRVSVPDRSMTFQVTGSWQGRP